LFQGRFGAVLVEQETQARVLSRYVHLNPHRAGLAPQPGQYHWCSYRYYLNPRGAPEWLDWRTILGEISPREAAARVAYRRFVEEGVGTQLRNPLADVTVDGLLGSEEFVKYHAAKGQAPQNSKLADKDIVQSRTLDSPTRKSTVPDLELFDRMIQFVADEFEVPSQLVRQRDRHGNLARQAAIWLAHESLKWKLREIAVLLGDVSESAVRDSLKRTQEHFGKPAGLAFREAITKVEARLERETRGRGPQISDLAD
jgi:putative transposase